MDEENQDQVIFTKAEKINLWNFLKYDLSKYKDEGKERIAWYMYDWANQSIASAAFAVLLPVFLNNIAADEAYKGSLTVPCPDVCTLQGGCPGTKYPCKACVVGEGVFQWNPKAASITPIVPKTVDFMFPVGPFEFAMKVTSLSVALQAFLYITCGPMGDYGTHRKKGLVISTVLCCICLFLYLAITKPSMYVYAGILTILMNGFYGLGTVFYNSFLPLLASEHKDYKASNGDLRLWQRIQNAMSGIGVVIGYVAGIITCVVCAMIALGLTKKDGSSFLPGFGYRIGTRAALAFCGGWFMLFSLWTFKYMREYPGKDLPAGERLIFKGWINTYRTLREIMKYPETAKFALAWFVYSDACSTLSTVGVLAGTNILCMNATQILYVVIEVHVVAIFGCYFFFWLEGHFKIPVKYVLMMLVLINVFISAWGMSGFFESSQVGMRHVWELFWPFGFFYGLLIGALHGYSRATWADLSPPGKESEFFAFYAITDKGSSWLGPLVCAEIYNKTNSICAAFFFLCGMSILGIILIFWVDHEKGMSDVGRVPEREAHMFEEVTLASIEKITVMDLPQGHVVELAEMDGKDSSGTDSPVNS
ncbi:hypothetical protein GUITHDRAFT_147474 [Guillardia theta CCMP2712]|uniref:Autophagy-related protein n=1 Tax=Guillardia theta (strain CCMP2712) TaxID=905079 RepID=L1ICV9_GUITC|nr:hypothetical protein GUITHDRAFT_147474 [Guillardia theta CCMP2712]EKX34073.1 hypothetical protein GUITHDRAFT_147474 [Guillardia theta CCMP2712]|mmetsp:Transcript_34724/g.108720  ORF Transcript_34724/g.108720 Transcript_34724/m.108720 type:complete len:592 (-) Transcript_34724:133-1908(-)|eukprot:XP_005821053.1 hypothetical protein GUITHDRAFT_147474 [Guillardia theta CCMP2712]